MAVTRGMRVGPALLVVVLGLALAAAAVAAEQPRAAYFYDYMPPSHIDSLAAAGFDRAIIHALPDSVNATAAARLRLFVDHGRATGVTVVPEWLLQQPSRLATRPPGRRYTWGRGTIEAGVACPLDSTYWRGALLGRAEEFLAADPRVTVIAVDLEVYGAGRHHYDGGPCRCATCVAEYAHGRASVLHADPATLTGLMPWEEARVARITGALLAEFAARHPAVELGVFDLDLDSFVHRGLARALAKRGVPTVDYTERTYTDGAGSLAAARARLARVGHAHTPVLGGLWFKRFDPAGIASAVRALRAAGAGWFAFTTYSLWQSPARLDGPYTLQAAPGEYWRAMREANTTP